MKQTKAITLISLVITVVVLLIISGVAISIVTNSEGIFGKAGESTKKWNNQLSKEEQILADLNAELNNVDSKENIPNRPKLVDGMTPIKFTLPDTTNDTVGTVVKTSAGDSDWYNYDVSEKRWANAQTLDGSMWVWIPRYAYRINNETKTAEIVFLRGTSDNYFENGTVKTAKRCTSTTDKVDTTTGFTVHPAFTNESSSTINYRNGGWDKELTGIWVAKFEAGYATSNGNSAPVVASNVKYDQSTVYARATETGSTDKSISARNWLDGIYGEANKMAIKYPTFQPLTYSMNYINHSDAYELARDLTSDKNIYGFTSSTADTHLMKDSEWGMVAYFSQSQYGLGTTDIAVNNINLESGQTSETREKNAYASVYAVTGLTGTKKDLTKADAQVSIGECKIKYTQAFMNAINAASTNTAVKDIETGVEERTIYKWNQYEGQKASSSGNMYGIYDLSGGLWEKTAAYVANGRSQLSSFGKTLAWDGTDFITASTKYAKVYAHDTVEDEKTKENTDANLKAASQANYALAENKLVYGNAMHETGNTTGTGNSSWYDDYSYFLGLSRSFSVRGGGYDDGSSAGLFPFNRHDGNSTCNCGFRPVVVAK